MTDSANEATVWALWLAHRDQRIHEMVELMDPAVVWTRPGPTEHRGHEEIRGMFKELWDTTGGYRSRLDDVSEVEPGLVLAKGRVFSKGSDEGVNVTWRLRLRRGLITSVVTQLPEVD